MNCRLERGITDAIAERDESVVIGPTPEQNGNRVSADGSNTDLAAFRRTLSAMSPTLYGLAFTAALFLGMLLLLEIGHRMGTRRLARDPGGARQGLGVVEGAVFSLLGLMIAFTFSGAAGRFDARRR